MPQRRPNELVPIEASEQHSQKIRGGCERVARRFLPSSSAATSIRVDAHNRRRALSRRRLARLIDPRRVVS
jgi:hypothetical protein